MLKAQFPLGSKAALLNDERDAEEEQEKMGKEGISQPFLSSRGAPRVGVTGTVSRKEVGCGRTVDR